MDYGKCVNFDKLLNYGFKQTVGKYVYETNILDGQFSLTVFIDDKGEMATKLIDTAVDEVYTLHLVADACGTFVGEVRAEYEKVLNDIADKCFERGVFNTGCAREVTDFARSTYGNELEFLWDKLPEAAVLRRSDSKRWYAAFMKISKNKLGLDGGELVEIIDVRFDPDELSAIIDNKRFFAGYHMNKRRWLTILLDGSVKAEEICSYLKKSYDMAK